jgi:hypothetical protein
MPLLVTLAVNFALGALAALAAARELRASPRAIHHARAFRALAVHQGLVAMPVVTYLLVRAPDWMVSYVVDGARLPSALVLALVVLHGGLAVGGFAIGARLLRDHRARSIGVVSGAVVGVAVLGMLVAHRRVGVAATFVQFGTGFGLQPFWGSNVFALVVALTTVWLAGAGHLLWSLRRRL